MTPPTVSILLSVYNGAQTLPRCLHSIQEQTYTPLEIICINDASTDDSLSLLQHWKKEHPRLAITILIHKKNVGLTQSLMHGLPHAHGEYIARLDSDDWWTPDKLTQQVAYLENHPNYGLVGCWYINVRPTAKQVVRLPQTDKDIRRTIFWRNPFGHSCVLIRKKVLDQVSGYDTHLRYGQDRDLWFRLLPVTKMANLPEFLCYRTVDASISTTKTRAQIWQQFRTVHKYIRLYHPSPLNYFSFIEPLAVFITPTWLRSYIRTLYDRLSSD